MLRSLTLDRSLLILTPAEANITNGGNAISREISGIEISPIERGSHRRWYLW